MVQSFTLDLIVDIFCISVMLILISSFALQKIRDDKPTDRFIILIYVVIGFLLTGILSSACEGKPSLIGLSYVVNLLNFLFIDAAIIAFSAYLATLVGSVRKKWEKVMNPAVFFTYVRIPLVILLTITGNLFVIDQNGEYIEKQFAIIPYIITGLSLLMLVLVVNRNQKYFTKKQFVVILMYLILPIPAIITEMITEIYCLTGIALTISVLLIYVLVQTNFTEAARIRESVLEEISSTDLLTDLNNRRAFYNRFAMLEPSQNVGVAFCDMNGLKYTNDNFGHAEGDKLIISFANILLKYFEREDVFRISGDEFVVIVRDISKEDWDKKVDQLTLTIKSNNSIAALGSSFGTGCCIEQLVSVAESSMYENKRTQYSKGVAIPRLTIVK